MMLGFDSSLPKLISTGGATPLVTTVHQSMMQPKFESSSSSSRYVDVVYNDTNSNSKMLPPPTQMTRYESHMLPTTGVTGKFLCSLCDQFIQERYLLYTNDRLNNGRYWHVNCLRCQSCGFLLSDLGNTFFTKENTILCKHDYMRIYGSKPCQTCSQIIQTQERVMRVPPNYYYHIDCFCCYKCRTRLVTGDRYVFVHGHLFCEKDHPLKSPSITNERTTTTKRGGGAKRGSKSTRGHHQQHHPHHSHVQQQQQPPSSTPLQQHHPHIHQAPNISLMDSSTHSILSMNGDDNY